MLINEGLLEANLYPQVNLIFPSTEKHFLLRRILNFHFDYLRQDFFAFLFQASKIDIKTEKQEKPCETETRRALQ